MGKTYFAMGVLKETRGQDILMLDLLMGTKTVEDQDDLLTTPNSLLQAVTVQFPANVMSGARVRNALGLFYRDDDINRVYGPSLVFVPIETAWWKANRVWPGIEFDTDNPYPRITPNTPEEIQQGRDWNASVCGLSWEQLSAKVRTAYAKREEHTLTKLEQEVYDAWA